jgi:ADP-ribose pyrophosphatase YjhB (NUDIX family)
LVLKLKEKTLGLPGGFITSENLDEAAGRILKNRTGAENIYLNQFKTFGDLDRSEEDFEEYPDKLWNKQRFVSVGFMR